MAKASHPVPGARPTLLCVDDSKEELELRKEYLEMHGYEVLIAPDGPGGLELLRQQGVDAVLLDYQMPGIDGSETARLMRKLQPKARIILFSGYLEPIATTDAELFDAVLWKGEPLQFLLSTLEHMTRKTARQSPRKPSRAVSQRSTKNKKTRRSA